MKKRNASVKWVIMAAFVLAAGCAMLFGVVKPKSVTATEKEDQNMSQSFAYGTSSIQNPKEAGDLGWNGQYVWYGGIKWRVLSVYEPEGMLLFADKIPDEYREEWTNRVYKESKGQYSWLHSDIRTYLNTDFCEKAFTDMERMAIET